MWFGRVGRVPVEFGAVWQGMAQSYCKNTVGFGPVKYGRVGFGGVWPGRVRYGKVWSGMEY